MFYAIKTQYNRKSKSYDVVGQEVQPGEVGYYLHSGFLVYQDTASTIKEIENGRLLGHWKPAQREAILNYLRSK